MSDENTIVVLIGDFNTQIDDFIFMPLEDYMLEARSTSIEKNDIATYNGWKEPMSLIDFIFYRNAEAVSCFTLTDDYGASFISDHYPVKVVLKY